jgi:delta11-fatty-acid desaturase
MVAVFSYIFDRLLVQKRSQLARRYGPYVFIEARSPVHRDNKQNSDLLLTHIHGQWYDLTTFEHPGGPIALSLVHRRDGTALFESHHPLAHRARLMKILAQYGVQMEVEIDGCELIDLCDDGHRYVWEGIEGDSFVSDLRHHTREYFATEAERRGVSCTRAAHKATPQRWALILSLMSAFFISLPRYIRGDWLFLIVTPLLAWVTAVNYWHDGLHFSLSTDWRVNAWLPYLFPYYSSPWMWYHEHVIGHHAYPNIEHRDPDLAHAPQLMREHSSIRWKTTHVGQAQWYRILLVWSVALGLGLSILNDAKANFKMSYNNAVPYMFPSRPRLVAHVFGRAAYISLVHIWPYLCFPWWKALIWATFPGIILSLCFMVNTQINHLIDDCAHASDTNFYKHQVVTAQNFGINSYFCYYLSGGLNYQIEHHLFPTVNHCHLPALSRGVRMICEKHSVPYHLAAGYCDALIRHVSHTLKMERMPS